MDLGIRGKRALVAGSSSGIGLACATLLAKEGVELFLVARREEKLAEVASSLRSEGAKVAFAGADLSGADGVRGAFEAAEREMGGVDILVNNAGGPKSGPFDALSDDDWAGAFELTLMSTVRMTRAAIAGMKERRWGRVITIASTSVKQPIENLMLSNSLRMGVVGFLKTLSNEVGPSGITINTVAPGYATTDRLQSLAESRARQRGESVAQVLEAWSAEVPLRRLGTPEEVAAAVVFLASEQAAYVNGIVLPVDGGRLRASL